MKVWFCRNCGYEVGSRGRCHRCRQRLVPSLLEPLAPGADEEEVGYRLEDWADRTRGRLIEALNGDQVAHRFEGDELVVAVEDEQRVDVLVERVTATAELDGVPDGVEPDEELVDHVADEIDEEVESALRQLLHAAGRLRQDPTDMEADGEVAEASAGVFMVDGWVGADDDTWAAVGRVTRRLLAALGSEEALEEEITTEAGVLATLIRPLLADPAARTNGAGREATAAVVGGGDLGVTATAPGATAVDPAATATSAAAATSGAAATSAAAATGAVPSDGPDVLPAGGSGAPAAGDEAPVLDDRVGRDDDAAGEAAAAALGLAPRPAPSAGGREGADLEGADHGGADLGGGTGAGAGTDPASPPADDDAGLDVGVDHGDGDAGGGGDDGSSPVGIGDAGSSEGAAGGDGATEGDGELLLGGGPETSYEAPGWLPDQRALLSVLLERQSVPHVWDGTDLVVPSADEEAVEALFDKIGGVADEEDDEARYQAIEELFAAVTRLVADPDDDIKGADVVRNAAAVEGPTPLGFDDGAWLGLRRRTRTLADAVEHKAHPDVVSGQATALRDALRALI